VALQEVTLPSGKKIQLDEDGFLADFNSWDEEVAKYLAEKEGIKELTEDHWKIINYLRDYYKKYQVCPPIRQLVKETGYKLKEIYKLFPSGPAKGACRVAGAPKPTGCV